MQAYIDQLLEAIAAAHQPPQDQAMEEESFSTEDHFDEIEQWLATEEPPHTFGYYCGLEPEQFPPAEQLANNQLQAVFSAFNKLLFSWNIDVELPKEMPLTLSYTLLLRALAEKVQIVRHGFEGIDFCTGDPTSCPFKEYGSCKEFTTTNKDTGTVTEHEDGEIPY